jgi:hypothetical protein
VLGRRGEGLGRWAGLPARGKKERKGQPAWDFVGWARRKGREGERGKGLFLSFFFQISFKFIFQTFTLKSNKNPCIQIMMHKHLFSLNYFSDVYLFKSQFV